jgi:hypothetical protein
MSLSWAMRTNAAGIANNHTVSKHNPALVTQRNMVRAKRASGITALTERVEIAIRRRSFHRRKLDIRMHRTALSQDLLQPISVFISEIAADDRGLVLRAMKPDEKIGALNADLLEEFRPLLVCLKRQEHRGRPLLWNLGSISK